MKLKVVLEGDPKGEHLYIQRDGSTIIIGSIEFRSTRMGLSTMRDRIFASLDMGVLKKSLQILEEHE